MKQRLISIFLTLSLIVPVVGMYGWLQLKKHTVRKEVKHRLMAAVDRSELVLLRFSLAEAAALEWEHSNEFEYHRQMYDVVATECHADSIHYWCWPDHAETTLNRQLTALARAALQHDPEHRNGQQQMARFFQQLYLQAAPAYVLVPVQTHRVPVPRTTALKPAPPSAPPGRPPQVG